MNLRTRWILLLALAAPLARAQELNIDVGCTAGTNPSNAYGAAADQPGFWSWLNANALGVYQGMSGLGGGVPIVGVKITGGNGCFSQTAGNGTFGDDEALMDDIEDLGGVGAVSTYEFAGLAAGPYWVYTYAWAPDNAAFRTKVEVAGSLDPAQVIGGPWPGAHRYQETFARHLVLYAGGPPLVVTATTIAGAGSVNGFQLSTGPCEIPLVYGTSEPNTDGCTPVVSYAGTPSLAAAAAGFPFWLMADDVKAGASGTWFYSRTGPDNVPFTDWFRWVAPIYKRSGTIFAGGAGACGGTMMFDFNNFMDDYNNSIPPPPDPFTAGQGVWVQCYSRDSADAPANSNLTAAIHFTVCP